MHAYPIRMDSGSIFCRALTTGERLKLMDLPCRTLSHLRGVSIVTDDRLHSWKWWLSDGGRKYQALCDKELSGKQQSLLYFLPAASVANKNFRGQYGNQLIAVMQSQMSKDIRVGFQLYSLGDLYSHELAQKSRSATLHDAVDMSGLNFEKVVFGWEKAESKLQANSNFGSLPGYCETIEFSAAKVTPRGSIIDMVICDSNYCQIKLHHSKPVHSVVQAEQWVLKFDGWMQSSSKDFDSLAKKWITS